MTKSKVILPYIPTDKELLAAFGKVALHHEHMNDALRMTIKSLAGLTPAEARAATKYDSSRQLRRRARKLARKRLGEGAPLLKLEAMLTNCERLTERRNELVHGLWAQELDGAAQVRDADGSIREVPTLQELEELATEIMRHTNNLNMERVAGFLMEALTERN